MYKINKLNDEIVSINKGDLLSIPVDKANADYQDYLDWEAEGNTAEVVILDRGNSDKEKRRRELPSVEEQLEIIYEQGLDAWKAQIKPVMDKYAKKP